MSSKPKTVQTSSTTTAQIPDFLRPMLTQAAQTSGRALGDLESTVGDIVGSMPSAGNLNSQAIQGILDYVGGNDPNRNLALQKLTGIAGGGTGRDLAYQYNQLGAQPGEYQQQAFNQQPVNPGVNGTFQDLMARFDPNSAGVQASADASIRAAQPYIFSGFGKSGGVGAVKSGLAQTAMQQAASDAFARLYDSAENRRLGAASGLSSAEAQKAQAAAMAAQASAMQQGNRISERQLAANLMSQERNNQFNALGLLSGVGLQDASLLQGAAMTPLNAQSLLFNSSAGATPGNVIGQSTQGSQPVYRNTAGGILGGAASGAGIAQALGASTPWGLAATIGGGLLGAF